MAANDPHADAGFATAGPDPADADVGVVLIHGRGATAGSVLGLADEFERDDVACVAPQAANRTWYPNPFTAPTESNQPHLDSALGVVERAVGTLTDAGIAYRNVLLLGFSQGACLTTEYAARNARRYGGVVALSGGLIGETIERERYGGDFDGTPAFVGCSDSDPHIPESRVHETTDVLDDLGAAVDERLYPDAPHGIFADEVDAVNDLVAGLGD
ncbi:putative esterase [Halarchaeum rubridurum]|uniref:Phospholipase/carboxylesterase n=1 Tax=Halarchaeum rubridurum TaxID=489911 RepID=A0A830FZL9_9EURY|nr:dienelactone hydrolase family protein [Halarchaeum rubridurum]MBP1955220.1 putative esterase [Halarchaeum rubridurum]GGM68021.1 phospholipase/carboxylesterase [Halarchaeum rubridurum]